MIPVEKAVVEEAHGRDRETAAEVLRRAMRRAGVPDVEVERRLAARGLVETRDDRG